MTPGADQLVHLSDLISVIKSQSKNESDQLTEDGEWSLFARFGESIFRFSRDQMPSDEARAEQLSKFASATSHQERVGQLLDQEQFNAVIEMLRKEMTGKESKSGKDVIKAKERREAGNKMFGKGSYNDAISEYNQAIRLAPVEDVELVLAMANRSAAFFHLNKIDDCLKDIDYVLDHNYPVDRQYMIYARKIQCFKRQGKLLDAQAEAVKIDKIINDKIEDSNLKNVMFDFVKSSSDKNLPVLSNSKTPRKVDIHLKSSNPELPKANALLRAEQSASKGRYITATDKVEPSEVLISEMPFATWLKPSLYSNFCYHCLKNIQLGHCLPSRESSLVIFCSEICEAESWTKYHSFECKLMDILQILSAGHLALRMVLSAGLVHAIELAARDGTQTKKKPFTGNYIDILSLVENVESHDVTRLCSLAAGVAFLATVMRPSVQKLEKEFSGELFAPLCGLLLKHVLQINCNAIGIQFDATETDLGHPTLGSNLKVIGLGIYPTCSLLNHSCEKKVYTLFSGSTICVKSTSGFAVGDEITLCYGPHHRKMSTSDRKDVLKKCYFFDCKCAACDSKRENLGAAFACPKCTVGALVTSSVGNYCVACGAKDVDLGLLLAQLEQAKTELEAIWPVVIGRRYAEAETRLQRLLVDKSKFFYVRSDLVLEVKEKLAYVLEEQKKLRPAMKLWLDCFYGQVELDAFEDSYEALFYLLKITSALVEEADANLDMLPVVKSNYDKAKKYFSRAMTISKRLQGKEARVLEARSDLLSQMPEPTAVAKDLHALENYLRVAAEQMAKMG